MKRLLMMGVWSKRVLAKRRDRLKRAASFTVMGARQVCPGGRIRLLLLGM